MLEIQGSNVIGFKGAISSMRNPLNSWNNSDSYIVNDVFVIGEDDMKLCKRLIKAGSSDRKFLRMIHVQVNVLAPLYFWKEADQYKVGTTTNSCSTMHTLHKKELTLEDFSIDNVTISEIILPITLEECFVYVVDYCNRLREKFLETKDRRYWKALIQLLPESYNQLRTWDLDYETLMNIYFQRRYHKLNEWVEFCEWIKTLPYMEEFINAI